MHKWECIVCGWVYDEAKGAPESGIPAGTPWSEVPEDFLCPDCGVGKEDFEIIEEDDNTATATTQPDTQTKNNNIGSNKTIVVIGTGLAGYNLAKEFRKYDKDTDLLLLSADDGRAYSKPMLSTGFTRKTDADGLATATAEEMAQQLNIKVMPSTRIVSIDTDKHSVCTEHNQTINYGKLVLAIGAAVAKPPLSGDALDSVYSVNDLMDYARFRTALEQQKVKKLLIIGAGLIGSEFANDLFNGGYAITAVEPMEHTLPTLLPKEAGHAVRAALEKMGVKYHFGTVVSSLDKGPNGKGVIARLKNGTQLEVDLVVSAIGVRPRIDLAQSAGIKTNRGIVVDRFLQTSANDVYAFGDCAEVDGLVLYYVAPLMACARALGKTLSGTATAVQYPAMPVTIKTPFCPIVVSPPPIDKDGKWIVEADGANVVAQFRDTDNKLLGFALTGTGVSQKIALQKELPFLLD